MIADQRFRRQPRDFWANVRTISQAVGYALRGKESQIKVPAFVEIQAAYRQLGLNFRHLGADDGVLTPMGQTLLDYFAFRAERLQNHVRVRLMNAERARSVFEEHRARLNPKCPIPTNKQRGHKKAPAYLTGLVNMLIEANCAGSPCDFDPRELTTVTRDGVPLRTLARRVDGAFPSPVNPVAVWEIKEYYYTTTFGSRVAGGVYESLLDGMELEELREHEGIDVLHYLAVDAYFTWWDCGKSYLCRMIDMLHMGYVDEVLFGYEVVERLPALVAEWAERLQRRS